MCRDVTLCDIFHRKEKKIEDNTQIDQSKERKEKEFNTSE